MRRPTLASLLAHHPFGRGMRSEHLLRLAACSRRGRFSPGEYVFREGDHAASLYAIRSGRVALEVFAFRGAPRTVQTLQAGDVLGSSWMEPPYRCGIDARALEATEVIAIDAMDLRRLAEEEPYLGYELMRRMARVVNERLSATKAQLLTPEPRPPSAVARESSLLRA